MLLEGNFNHFAHGKFEATRVGLNYFRAADFCYYATSSGLLGNSVAALVLRSLFVENMLVYSPARLGWCGCGGRWPWQGHRARSAPRSPLPGLVAGGCPAPGRGCVGTLHLQPLLPIPHSSAESPAGQPSTGAGMNLLFGFSLSTPWKLAFMSVSVLPLCSHLSSF